MFDRSPSASSTRRTWAVLLALIALALVTGAYWYYQAKTKEIRKAKYQTIAAICELQAGQIVQWRKERLADVRQAAESPFFRRALEGWLQAPENPGLREDWRQCLRNEQKAYGYDEALLVAPDGRILLAATEHPAPIDRATRRAIETALVSHQPMISNFHRNAHNVVNIDIIAPVLDTARRPLAVLVLSSDAGGYPGVCETEPALVRAVFTYTHDGLKTVGAFVNGELCAERDDQPVVPSFGGGNLAMPLWKGNHCGAGDVAEVIV